MLQMSKCGPNAARMWPEDEILQPEINPWKFSVARARPEPKPQARNPTRTMKKVARPSPSFNCIWIGLSFCIPYKADLPDLIHW